LEGLTSGFDKGLQQGAPARGLSPLFSPRYRSMSLNREHCEAETRFCKSFQMLKYYFILKVLEFAFFCVIMLIVDWKNFRNQEGKHEKNRAGNLDQFVFADFAGSGRCQSVAPVCAEQYPWE
jgi:hypothetical protein